MSKIPRLFQALPVLAQLPLLRPFLLVIVLTTTALAAGAVRAQEAVSAQAAAAALSRGAVVVDMRSAVQFGAGHVADALWLPQLLTTKERSALQVLVSDQGIDLSREVVLVGEPGDALAYQAAQQLARYASGRVMWLVGGTVEWQISGRALHTSASSPRAAVPQYLVAFAPQAPLVTAPRMAQAYLRDIR